MDRAYRCFTGGLDRAGMMTFTGEVTEGLPLDPLLK